MKAKKVMALALAAVMLIVTSVAATIAYLTDDDVVVNTFTVGKVYINLDEFDYDKDENNEDNVTVNGEVRDKANKYHLLPGQTYAKDPTVTVKADSENCYVRVLVSVNDMSKLTNAFPSDYDYSKWNIKSWYGADGTFLLQNLVAGWDNETWEYAGYKNGVYEFRYADVVEKSSTDTELVAVFTDVVVPGEIDNDHLKHLQGAEITVTAHAIQATGFANADAAWEAWS